MLGVFLIGSNSVDFWAGGIYLFLQGMFVSYGNDCLGVSLPCWVAFNLVLHTHYFAIEFLMMVGLEDTYNTYIEY